MTHFVEYDRIHRGRKSIALCGDFVDERDISNAPTCEFCQRELAQTAEAMFGDEPVTRPVKHRDFDPITGTDWKRPA